MSRHGRTLSLRLGYLLILFASHAYGQAEIRLCPAGFKVSFDYDYVFPSYGGAIGTKLIYGLQRPAAVSSAWVEVWDGGLRLLHQEVPVRPHGDYKWMHLDEVPHTPDSLTLAIYDTELPLFGDGPGGPSKGGTDFRSTYWAGSSPEEPLPFSLSAGASYQISEGDERGELQLDGLFVGTPTDVLLEQQDQHERWIAREYLLPQVVDRDHIQLTIPERFLEEPGILGLSNRPDGPEVELGTEAKAPQQTIYVYSKDSPTLSEVEPSEISAAEANEGSFHIPVHLRGSGFTPASFVVQSLYSQALGNNGRTRFISPADLEFDLYKNEVVSNGNRSVGRPIRLWVVNGDWLHVSEPQEIRVIPSPQSPPDPFTAQVSRITSVSPNPIKLIDPAGPEFLQLILRGEYFRRGETVVAIVQLDSDDKEVKLRTQFVSATEFRAWLPRALWSEHRLKYGFGVKTQKGVCSVEISEGDNN